MVVFAILTLQRSLKENLFCSANWAVASFVCFTVKNKIPHNTVRKSYTKRKILHFWFLLGPTTTWHCNSTGTTWRAWGEPKTYQRLINELRETHRGHQHQLTACYSYNHREAPSPHCNKILYLFLAFQRRIFSMGDQKVFYKFSASLSSFENM